MVATNVLDTARSYVAAKLSVIPVRADGTKAPKLPGWRTYSQRRPTGAELAAWFGGGVVAGIGVTPGPASGNLAVLDIESADAWDRWSASIPAHAAHFLKRCRSRTAVGSVH